MLTVAIDARWIFSTLSGVGVYTRNLIRSLSLLDQRNRYLLLFDNPDSMERELQETGAADRNNISAKLLPYSVFSLRNQLSLPHSLTQSGIDVFHSPNFMIPLAGVRQKSVVTVHDLIPLLFPHYTRRSKKRRVFPIYKRIMRRVARQADAILADSECTRQDILRTLKVPGRKVHRIHLGVDEKFSPAPSTGRVRRRFGISGRLILCVGRQDPYKNVIAAVKAFEMVAGRRSDLNCHMLIVGEKDPRYPEVSEYISRRNLSGKVVTTNYLADDALVNAYREADLLIHLSLYEGFGLPPLEAMACGTPVVCSDRSSLPEVLGDAACFTNPYNAPKAAETIITVLTNETLKSQLIAKGITQAAKYRWETTARQVVEVYRKVAVGARGAPLAT